jgi:hypothetical protein
VFWASLTAGWVDWAETVIITNSTYGAAAISRLSKHE